MKDNPKSIWKRPLGKFYIWLAIAMPMFIVIFSICSLSLKVRGLVDWFVVILLSAIGAILFAAVVRFLVGRSMRFWMRSAFGFACLLTLIGLCYAEENWRGKHDWEKFKQRAAGEKFDLKDFIPAPVPDDQNFAFSPIWIAEIKSTFSTNRAYAWYGDRIYSQEISNIAPKLPDISGNSGTNIWPYSHLIPDIKSNWTSASVIDLKPWQSYYRELAISNPVAAIPFAPAPQTPAQDVLLALSKFNPAIERLRHDSALPYSRFPVQYNMEDPAETLLPHLAAVKRNSQVLQLRAVAELQAGETDKAFDDVTLMFRLIGSVDSEPWIISHLVRLAVLDLTIQPVYEGLAAHQWSDQQLAELDSELSKFDFPADYERSLRSERAAAPLMIDFIARKPNRFWMFLDWGWPNRDELGNKLNRFNVALEVYLMPQGWWEQNKIVVAKVSEQYLFPIVDEKHRTVSPEKATAAEQFQHTLDPSPYNLFAIVLAWPGIANYAEKVAYGQNSVDMARVAIALERYRVAHGDYPESLDALSPQFMTQFPHDIIGGQPLHYRRVSSGDGNTFILYSVGWDETDDGGVIGLPLNGGLADSVYQGVDHNRGDWVWRYPH